MIQFVNKFDGDVLDFNHYFDLNYGRIYFE
jgi:hypothetical protein